LVDMLMLININVKILLSTKVVLSSSLLLLIMEVMSNHGKYASSQKLVAAAWACLTL